MANVDIKVFENISVKEKVVFDRFINENWGEDKPIFLTVPRLWAVGYRRNKIIGIICVTDNYNIGEINSVVTRIDCRRQGVMSQMLQKFTSEYLPKYKFKSVIVYNNEKKLDKLFLRVGLFSTTTLGTKAL
jgi:hypothetical protein